MKIKSAFCLFLFTFIFCTNIQAQEGFDDLIAVGDKELESELLFKKNIKDVSYYDAEGNSIKFDQALSLLASHKQFPEFYTNKNREVEAVMIKNMAIDVPSAHAKFKCRRIFKTEMDKNISDNKSNKSIDFSAVDMQDTSYVLSKLKGKVVVLNFWFINCKPCVKEMPDLNKIVEKYENNENVVFLAFSWDRKSDIESFLKKYRFLYNIIPQSRKIISSYGVSTFPTNMIIDQKGNTVYKEKGLHENSILKLENKIASLIN